MSKELSTENKSALIRLVQENSCLYDVTHADWKNADKKRQLWKDIADKLQLGDGAQAQTAWKILRDTFAKNKKRAAAKSGASAADAKIKWVHQQEMAFVEDYPDQRPTQSTLTLSQKPSASPSTSAACSSSGSGSAGMTPSATDEEESIWGRPLPKTPSSTKRARRSDGPDPEQLLVEAIGNMEKQLERTESQVFADYLASQVDAVESLDKRAAVDLRNELLQVVAQRRSALLAAIESQQQLYPGFYRNAPTTSAYSVEASYDGYTPNGEEGVINFTRL